MYRPRVTVRLPRLHPSYQRYRRLPQFIRSSHYRQAQQNPRSLLALAYRALHRPYTGATATIRRSRRRVTLRNAVY